MVSRVMRIAGTVLSWVMAVAAVGMVIFTVFSVAMVDQGQRSLFGYQFLIVRSDSMSATDFSAGDIAIVRRVEDPSTLQEGDIISYISQDPMTYNETVTHKIRSRTTDAYGNPGFVTYGTSSGTDDARVVTYPYVTGKYCGKIPALGGFFMFLKTTPGYMLCIFLPFMLLIVYQGAKTVVLFQQYRREQVEELDRERELLTQEREQSAELMRQLQELRHELAMERRGRNREQTRRRK